MQRSIVSKLLNPCRLGASLLAMLLALNLTATSLVAQEDRPPTAKLLPETTVAYFEFPNIRELGEKLQRSNGGKLWADENVAPLVNDLWEEGKRAYAEFVEPEIEMTADELLSLPTGQITIAVIAPKRKKPVFVFMIEMDEENEATNKFFEVGRRKAEEDGATFEEEETDDVTFTSVVSEGERVIYFQHQGLLVGSNSQDELDDIVDRWFGRTVEKIRPLEKNRKYVTIMNRCQGTRTVPPDVVFFVDPIELARSAFRGEMQAQFVINFLPILGLDGLLAVGGSSSMFVDEFESVMHVHALMSSPRKGVFEMLALKPGDYQPESFVPDAATAYYSTSIDAKKMISELEKIVDLFSSEGTFQSQLEENINEELGIDFMEDVIGSVTGRVSTFTWMEPPARFTGQVFGIGVELKDKEGIETLLDAILARIEEDDEEARGAIEERKYKGMSFWAVSDEAMDLGQERRQERRRERRERRGLEPDEDSADFSSEINIPQPAWGFIDDHFVITFSPQLYELMIETHRGDEPALAENEQFKRVTNKMTNLLKDDMPCFTFYQDPREVIKAMVEAGKNNSGKFFDWVEEAAEADGDEGEDATGLSYIQGVRDALDRNPLPSFDQIEEYFQPNGMFVTNEETGYHMLWFQLMSPDDEGKQ